jgi:photosystem II stability/assembly factor-like uncharacterized protein
VGEAGTVIATTDGGAKWQKQESGTRRWLYGVAFVNEREGWAVGEEGLILRTADGGENWVVQISGATSNLLSIHAVNARKAWAVGVNGLILSTADGGATWRQEKSGTTTPLRAVTFHGDDGWAAGRDGVILRYGGVGSRELRTILD